MPEVETRKALYAALGPAWKKRLIAARLALIDGRKPLFSAGVHPECLGGVVEAIDELIRGRE